MSVTTKRRHVNVFFYYYLFIHFCTAKENSLKKAVLGWHWNYLFLYFPFPRKKYAFSQENSINSQTMLYAFTKMLEKMLA